MLFWEFLFQNVQKPFHTFLHYICAFFLFFLFASARYFLDGSDAFKKIAGGDKKKAKKKGSDIVKKGVKGLLDILK